MFEHLKNFRVVLVSGPQRSGTTICTKMIAHDTGLEFIRESDYANDEQRLRWLVGSGRGLAIHAPAHAHLLHDFCVYPDLAVVFMQRPTAEIIASQERIGWTWEAVERGKYGDGWDGPICEVKRAVWEQVQKPVLPHPFEVAYHDLAAHPLWVPPEERAGWHFKQIDPANVW